MDDEQTGLQNSGSVIQQDPEPTFTEDVSLMESLQSAFPEYKGLNPHHFKKKLVDDTDFFNEVSNKYFKLNESAELAALAQENPESYQALGNRFKRNFKRDLIQQSYIGQNFRDTLVERSISLRDNVQDIPASQFKDIIKDNPDKYREFGFFDEENRFVYGDNTSDNLTFSQEIFENSDLHKQLQLDFYSQFENELVKSHNAPSQVTDDPTELTKAYKIFEQYQGEGLTQYVNLLQHEGAEEGIGQAYQRRQEAIDWFTGKEDIESGLKEFIVGKRVEGTGFDDLINQSLDFGVAPSLVAGMIKQESSFKADSIAWDGGVGLLQYMPTTAREAGLEVPDELYELDKQRLQARGEERKRLAEELGRRTKQISTAENDERLNPERTLEVGIKQFSERLRDFDYDPEKAVASWNAGRTAVMNAVQDSSKYNQDWKEFIPESTRQSHVPRVMRYANEYGTPSPLIYQQPTPQRELTEDVPADTNKFTFGGMKQTENGYEYMENNVIGKKLMDKFSSQDVREFYEDVDFNEDGWEMSQQNKDISAELYRFIHSGQNGIEIDDLMSTLTANSTHQKEDGYNKYTFDYNELPFMGKLAFNVLQQDPESGALITMEEQDGTWSIMPERYSYNRDRVTSWLNMFKDTKTIAQEGEDGNITYKEVPDNSGLSGVWNAAVSGVGAVAHTAFKFVYEPSVRYTAKFMDMLGAGDTREGLAFSEDMESLAGVSIFDVMSEDNGGALPNSLVMAGDMVQYMGAMYAGGSGIMKLGAAGLKSMTGIKTATDLVKYSSHMGKGSQRLGAMGVKLSNSLKNKAPWKTGFGVFVPAGALIEGTQPASTSFYELVPEMFGYEPTNDLSTFYRQASGWTQFGMDMAGSVVFDRLADHVLATAKFGKDSALKKWFGRKEFKSTIWDENARQFKMVDTPQYRTEFKEFWNNVGKDLDKLAIGAVGKSFVPKEGINTLSGFAKSFVDSNSDILPNIKKDIRDNVVWFNERLGDTKLSDSQIDQLTEEQYESFLKNTSDRIYGVLNAVDEDMPVKFANVLENQAPVIRELDDDVRNLHKLRERGENVIRKGNKLYQLEDNFWAVDLANSLRERSLIKTKQEVIDRISKQRNIPEGELNETQLEELKGIRERVENVLGTTVRTEDGELGYVTDFDDYGYTIKTESGSQTVKQLPEFTNEQVDQITRRVIQMRQLGGQVSTDMSPPPAPSRPLGLPSRGAGTTTEVGFPLERVRGRTFENEQQLFNQIDEIDNEISYLQQRWRNTEVIEQEPYGTGQSRGNVRREITARINELEETKRQRRAELERFYQRNPEVLNARIKDTVDQSYPRVAGAKYTDDIQLPEPEISEQAIVKNTAEDVNRINNLPKEAEDGATLNLDGTTYSGGGLIVPVTSKNVDQSTLTPELISDFVKSNADKIGSENVKVGLYKFPNSNQVSIDLNIAVPSKNRDAALAFGRLADQESLFDLDTGTNIKTGGTGKNPRSFTAEEFRGIAQALNENRIPEIVQPKKQKLVHYSSKQGLKELDPEFEGSGFAGEATKKGRPDVLGTYFYDINTKGERGVISGAKSKYLVEVDESKIYNLADDPDNIVKKTTEANQGAYNRDKVLAAVRDEGYEGYRNTNSRLPNAVSLFNKSNVIDELPVSKKEVRSREVSFKQKRATEKLEKRVVELAENLYNVTKSNTKVPYC